MNHQKIPSALALYLLMFHEGNTMEAMGGLRKGVLVLSSQFLALEKANYHHENFSKLYGRRGL